MQLFRFEALDMNCVRGRRWEFWKALATIEIFPNELYAFTQFSGTSTSTGVRVSNATVSGCSGQEVVRTPFGTLTWIPNDRRLSAPPHCHELLRRLRRGFAAWDPDRDLPKVYHSRRMPKIVASALGTRSSRGEPVFRA